MMKHSDINHLRRLLGWVRCEIGQSPDEVAATVKSILPAIGPVGDAAQRRLVEAHDTARAVPKYVRDAIQALEKNVATGDVVDHAVAEVLQIGDSAELAALRQENMTLTNKLSEVKQLVLKRPAMNAGLFETYSQWTGQCYALDWFDAMDEAATRAGM
jgi:hypothetical protein